MNLQDLQESICTLERMHATLRKEVVHAHHLLRQIDEIVHYSKDLAKLNLRERIELLEGQRRNSIINLKRLGFSQAKIGEVLCCGPAIVKNVIRKQLYDNEKNDFHKRTIENLEEKK